MLNTHGGETLYKDNSVHFGMMTSTLKDLSAEKTDATLNDDLDKNRIGNAADPDEIDKFHKAGKPDSDIPIHYAVGAGFARKVWTFASNSFAYAAVCESADAEFSEACFGKNLSHWAGFEAALRLDLSGRRKSRLGACLLSCLMKSMFSVEENQASLRTLRKGRSLRAQAPSI